MDIHIEKRLLQATIAVVSLIPLGAGFAGVFEGPKFLQVVANISADSHMRYLSGLLLGIGILAVTIIPNVEKHTERMAALTLIVFVGGLSRVWSLIEVGHPNTSMTAAFFVELVLTPSLYLWARRVARLNAEMPQSAEPQGPHLVPR
jgi:hypothetical protein